MLIFGVFINFQKHLTSVVDLVKLFFTFFIHNPTFFEGFVQTVQLKEKRIQNCNNILLMLIFKDIFNLCISFYSR